MVSVKYKIEILLVPDLYILCCWCYVQRFQFPINIKSVGCKQNSDVLSFCVIKWNHQIMKLKNIVNKNLAHHLHSIQVM